MSNALLLLVCLLIALSAMAVYGGFQNESHLRKEWLGQRQIAKQKDLSEKQRWGFSHLLNRLCDCLLQLGPDLEILEPSPNLAAMLFLTHAQALQGTSFCTYMASDEDRRRFIEAMGKDTSEEEPAGIIPLRLRDTQSREFQVHAYYTSFHDNDGAPYHIIGVAEVGERDEVVQPVEELGVRHTAIERVISDESTGSEITLESVAGSDFGEVSVTFDDSEENAIISCTSGFTALCGPTSDGVHLIDWVVDKERFSKVLQIAVNEFIYNCHVDLGPLVLRTPSATRAGIEYVINECTLDAISSVHSDCDKNSEQRFALRIRLGNINRRKSQAKKHGRSDAHKSKKGKKLAL